MAIERDVLPKTVQVATGTALSRVLGLAREMVMSAFVGAGPVMDMFVIAFTIPNVFRRLFGEGALSAAFIPVFTEEGLKPEGDARRLFNAVMSALGGLLIAVTFLGWAVCAVALLAMPLSANGRLFFCLLAILLPYTPLICLTVLQGSALNVKGHFWLPALAPAVMDAFWIAAALLAAGPAESRIAIISVGILISGAAQYAMQVPALARHGLSLRPAWDLANPGLRRILRLMLPVALGIGVFQVNVLADQIIAQRCVPGDGANSALWYGNRLAQLPLGVLGLALATAVFPAYARRAAERDHEGLKETACHALRIGLFLSLPCMGLILGLAEPMVRVLFQRGEFLPEATARTARVLACYSLGIWAFCGVNLLARAFHAMQDMRTPVRVATAMVGLNLALNLTLVWTMWESGLALATSIASATNMLLLYVLLRRRLGPIGGREILRSGILSALASAGACGAAWFANRALNGWLAEAFPGGTAGTLTQAVALAGALLAGSTVFAATAWLLRMEEMKEMVALVRRRKAEKGNG